MSIVTVDLHQVTHTCPGNPDPHVFDTRRTVAAITPGETCKNPVPAALDPATLIACGRLLPVDRQCAACRPLVIVRHTTTSHATTWVDQFGDLVEVAA